MQTPPGSSKLHNGPESAADFDICYSQVLPAETSGKSPITGQLEQCGHQDTVPAGELRPEQSVCCPFFFLFTIPFALLRKETMHATVNIFR